MTARAPQRTQPPLQAVRAAVRFPDVETEGPGGSGPPLAAQGQHRVPGIWSARAAAWVQLHRGEGASGRKQAGAPQASTSPLSLGTQPRPRLCQHLRELPGDLLGWHFSYQTGGQRESALNLLLGPQAP